MTTSASPKGLSKAWQDKTTLYTGIYFLRSELRGCFSDDNSYETTSRPWQNGDRGWVHLAGINLIEWNEE